MTKQETPESKLKTIIEYAVKNGWDNSKGWLPNVEYAPLFIFKHDFAKAFWKGKSCTCEPDRDKQGNTYHKVGCDITFPDWKRKLQQAVISEDPINYYFDYIATNKHRHKLVEHK